MSTAGVRVERVGDGDEWTVTGLTRAQLAALAVALHVFDERGGRLAGGAREVRDALDRDLVATPASRHATGR